MTNNGRAKAAYGACPIKRRRTKKRRRTQARIAADHAALLSIAREARPATVRQVFYLATVAGIVAKAEKGYKTVGRDLLALRRSGRMPYDWITDSTRWMRKPRSYGGVEDALAHVADTYRKALWADAEVTCEIWCEKDTIAGVLWEVTSPYDVPLMVCKGFPSDTYLYEAAQNIIAADRPAWIYYCGDRDPSGVLIDRGLERKLKSYAPGAEIHVERLAVLPEQVENWGLPTRPTKRGKNTHAKSFADDVSVELEAVPPARLRLIVRQAIERHMDAGRLWQLQVAERSEREVLQALMSYLPLAKGEQEDD